MSDSIQVTLQENRIFKPHQDFVNHAQISLEKLQTYRELGAQNPEAYWEQAAQELHWFKPWNKVLEWTPPFAKWFAPICPEAIDPDVTELFNIFVKHCCLGASSF
jgi:acetyl-CoA synthetase